MESGITVGPQEEKEKVIRLLYHWRDVFVEEMEDLPTTDLVVDKIPTYRHYSTRDFTVG